MKIDYEAWAIEILTGLYDCGRDWSAWEAGTMTESDFIPAEQLYDAVMDVAFKLEELIKIAKKTE